MNKLFITFCNLLRFANGLFNYICFRHASKRVKWCQIKNLTRILNENRNTEYGRKHDFDRIKGWNDFKEVPLSEYKDYISFVERIKNGLGNVLTEEKVRILQPTSGTSSSPKLIPHTKLLAKEFKFALDAWIADLFIQRPKLFLGTQYWAISPATEAENEPGSNVPVGFLDDAEYFGMAQRWIMDSVMAVPSEIRRIRDIEANQYVTLLFLLRGEDLRLISVWHPSYLTILLKKARDLWASLVNDIATGEIDLSVNISEDIRAGFVKRLKPAPKRSYHLNTLNPESNDFFRRIWPNLQVISCWRDGNVQSEITELEEYFNDVLIQGKGLLATEGVVSIPFGKSQQHVCAITSHFLEFQDDEGAILPAWNLEKGKSYSVILTTAGGLYRYKQKDRVEITGFYGKAPVIRFLGRSGMVSDFVGEKLHLEHVEEIIGKVVRQYCPQNRFAMLVPSSDGEDRRYKLLIDEHEQLNSNLDDIVLTLESELCLNYHYAHAREIGQLKRVEVTPVDSNISTRYRNFMINKGALAGTIKYPALCADMEIEKYLMAV